MNKLFWIILAIFILVVSWGSLKSSWALSILQAGSIMVMAISMAGVFMKFNE